MNHNVRVRSLYFWDGGGSRTLVLFFNVHGLFMALEPHGPSWEVFAVVNGPQALWEGVSGEVQTERPCPAPRGQYAHRGASAGGGHRLAQAPCGNGASIL